MDYSLFPVEAAARRKACDDLNRSAIMAKEPGIAGNFGAFAVSCDPAPP
jgi:hypothetical protein